MKTAGILQIFGRSIGFSALVVSLLAAPAARAHCAEELETITPENPSPQYGSAVEAERSLSKEILALLTTTDGTLAPLARWGAKTFDFPGWFVAWSSEVYPGKAPGSLRWDDIDDIFKRPLIAHFGKERGPKTFDQDRKIPGLRIRDQIVLKVPRATQLFGRTIPAGRQLWESSDALISYVEFRSPNDMNDAGGVELHFRTAQRAGDLQQDVHQFFSLLGLPAKRTHVHLPFRLARLTETPPPVSEPLRIEALQEMDFFRRINLAADMAEIMEAGGAGQLRDAKNTEVVDVAGQEKYRWSRFAPYYDGDLLGAFARILNHMLNLSTRTWSTSAKLGAFGFRYSGTYENPDLFGYEARRVTSEMGDRFYQRLLNSIERRRQTLDFGIPRAYFSSRRFLPGLKRDLIFQALWPHHNYAQKTGVATGRVLFEHWDLYRIQEIRRQDHIEIDYLAHDWSADPLFFGDLGALVRVNTLQIQAVADILAGQPIQAVLQRFLRESGLYQRLLDSVMVPGIEGAK